MTRPRSFRTALLAVISCVAAFCAAVECDGQVQTYSSIQEVRVNGLPTIVAQSHELSDVLASSLDTIINDKSVCCGKDSALESSLEKADPSSLKDVAAKLQGRQLLSDGRPIQVTAEAIEPGAINGSLLITTLREKHALLLLWNSHLYVCYGVTYLRDYDASGITELDTIHKLQLLDTRYSDSRRETAFNRGVDDESKVQGMLWVSVKQP